jgi:hypothetical protein
VAPHEEEEDSYYSKHSDEDGEELKEAYKILYIEFEKLRKARKQHIHELNSLQTEKSSLLLKIQDLEEKLLEKQIQLERVTDEKLTHMLSIQKSPTNKTRLGYVAPPSNIPSTSRTFCQAHSLQASTHNRGQRKGHNWWRYSNHSKASHHYDLPYAITEDMFDPSALSSRLRDQRSRKSCSDNQISAQDL